MTFTIVAFDNSDGHLGYASQSHFFGVGSVVGSAESGVGVVISQAFANTDWPHMGMAALREGGVPDRVLADLVASDPLAEYRQAVVVDAAGRFGIHSGARCAPNTSVAQEKGVIAVGNMLASETVAEAMVAAYRQAEGTLPDRLVAALAAAEAEGGDVRGSQSACLTVVGAERSDMPWQQVLADLRVDDHNDPVGELRRLLPIHRGFGAVGAALFAPPLVIGDAVGIDPQEAQEMMDALGEAAGMLGGNREADFWRAVILIRSGRVEEGSALLSELFHSRPQLREFADGLERVGILPGSGVEG